MPHRETEIGYNNQSFADLSYFRSHYVVTFVELWGIFCFQPLAYHLIAQYLKDSLFSFN